jgi:glycosyltransferase involved in cell wall biosynthesis
MKTERDSIWQMPASPAAPDFRPADGAASAAGPRRLHVAHVVEAFGAGCARHVIDLSRGLKAAGHRVAVIYSPLRAEAGYVDELHRLDGVAVHPLAMRRSVGLHDLTATLGLARLLRALGPFDVLHGHSSKAGALIRLLPGSIPGARIYAPHALRTMDPELGRTGRLFYGTIERLLAPRAAAILAGSPQEVREMEMLGIRRTRIRTLQFGVTPPPLPSVAEVRARLGLAVEDVVIGFVGRLVEQKAPARAIRALARIDQPGVRLVMVGGGPLEAALREMARDEGVADRVMFAGWQHAQTTMPAFDVFLMPSRYESTAIVLLEAAAAGTPIVSSPVGIAEDLLALEPGHLVANTDDPAPWAAALSELLEPANLAAAKRRAARLLGTRTEEAMISQLLGFYHEALEPALDRHAWTVRPSRVT